VNHTDSDQHKDREISRG